MGFQFNNQLQTKEIRIGRKGRGSKERKKKKDRQRRNLLHNIPIVVNVSLVIE
jgi:hypothetical protein